MRIEDIQVGKTYEGRKGQPRTVTARHIRGRAGQYFDVEYTTNGKDTRRCWCLTFASWAKSDEPTTTIALMREALQACRSQLKAFIGPDDALGQAILTLADKALASSKAPDAL